MLKTICTIYIVCFIPLSCTTKNEPAAKIDLLKSHRQITWIYDIQGRSHISPLERQKVKSVAGVVTAIVPNKGYYLQNPQPDDSPDTSEGLYVSTRKTGSITVGNLILVDGTVREHYQDGENSGALSVTTLRFPEVTILKQQVALPSPTILGEGGRMLPNSIICNDATDGVEESRFDPQQDGIDFYESIEGMLVQINAPLAVGTLHTAYGEFHVVGDGGKHATKLTRRRGLLLRQEDYNPERIMIDIFEYPSIIEHRTDYSVVVGDEFLGPIVGVVSYAFFSYKVLPTKKLPEIKRAHLPRETTALRGDTHTLSVAAYNVQNLSNQGPLDKMVAIARTIGQALYSPDILVLSEIQDNDGPKLSEDTDASETYKFLIDEISNYGGVTYSFIDILPVAGRDGGEPGGNIRVGILYNSKRVSLDLIPGGGCGNSGSDIDQWRGIHYLTQSRQDTA